MVNKTEAKINTHGLFVSLRIEPSYVEVFDEELGKRGIKNRNDGIRNLIAAWCRTPDALPIGLNPK